MADDSSSGVQTNLQSITGNVVEIRFADQLIGYLQSFSGQDDYGHQPLSGIGDSKPQEWAPGMYSGTLTADRAIIRHPSALGLLNNKSGANGAFTNVDGALQGKVFDVIVKQKDITGGSGTVLRKWRGCTIGAVSFRVQKHAIVYSDITLHALDVQEAMNGTGMSTGSSSATNLTDMDSDSGGGAN